MYFLLTVFLSVVLLDLPFTLTQTPPPADKPSTSTTANACPVLTTNRRGRNLHVDLVQSNQCQFIVSVTPQNVVFGGSVRPMNFLSGTFRRAGTPPGFQVPNCSPYNIRLQSNTFIIETRPRECFVTVALKEVLTPEWDATNGLRFTNKQSYEVNTAGPFPSSMNFPMVPRPGIPSSNQPAVPLAGLPFSSQPAVPRPGMSFSSQPAVPRPGMSFSSQPVVPRPGMSSTSQPAVPQPGMPSSSQPGFSPFVSALGQTVPQLPGFPSNPQPGIRMFMPLNLSNIPQAGSPSSQNTASTTATGGSPPPVPSPLTSGTTSTDTKP